MTSVVPTSRMVMIVIIVMCFVAARQCHGCYSYEEEHADGVLDLIFHGDCLGLDVHKPCQQVKVCWTVVFVADMSKIVDISPQSEKCHQSGIV
jgi:hypothetical protein